ncbi:MAG: 50S ribosomal protein L18 [Candidatus Bathyarchaeota archaeon]|nr:MAG: 50S ribosomal protein L18 [Candidatus Bathyarchaeota archaeon]
MAKGPRYRVPYRRRREAKTNYKARRVLATSKKPRFVVRPSNKNITIQLVTSKIEGDVIHTQASSAELDKYGWLGGRKNTPAAYLLGLLAGKKAIREGIEEANLDIGLSRPTKGAKVFAAVKGALDAGLVIPCDSDILPEPGRIQGETIARFAQVIEDPQEYERMFSGYLGREQSPQQLPDHFKTVMAAIEEGFQE